MESLANIAVGFAINWSANMLILPLFGFKVTGMGAFEIGILFTVISLARSYILRRYFNGLKFGNSSTKEKESGNTGGRQVTEESASVQDDIRVLSQVNAGDH